MIADVFVVTVVITFVLVVAFVIFVAVYTRIDLFL
jgi:hypothetical protein